MLIAQSQGIPSEGARWPRWQNSTTPTEASSLQIYGNFSALTASDSSPFGPLRYNESLTPPRFSPTSLLLHCCSSGQLYCCSCIASSVRGFGLPPLQTRLLPQSAKVVVFSSARPSASGCSVFPFLYSDSSVTAIP